MSLPRLNTFAYLRLAPFVVLVALFVAGCNLVEGVAWPREEGQQVRSIDTTPRPYFQAADWLWDPIPTDPVLDPYSSDIAAALAEGPNVANIQNYAISLRGPDEIRRNTRRLEVQFEMEPQWGEHPLGGDKMPYFRGTALPAGDDSHYAVADPTTGWVYSTYKTRNESRTTIEARWGGRAALGGEGREIGGSSTGAAISPYAAAIRIAEIEAGHIPHALIFSTDIAQGPNDTGNFRYPARKTDAKHDPAPHRIRYGTRVQLDPSIDVEAIPGITPAEVAIARALQTYGAYAIDNGGARMAFMFELARDGSISQSYVDAGLIRDYHDLKNIPWDRLRVLHHWHGGPDKEPVSVKPGQEVAEQGNGGIFPTRYSASWIDPFTSRLLPCLPLRSSPASTSTSAPSSRPR